MSNPKGRQNKVVIPCPEPLECQHASAILIHKSDGGVAVWKCTHSGCTQESALSHKGFFALTHAELCPSCGKEMLQSVNIGHSNYGYQCESCNKDITLGDLLPNQPHKG